MGNTTRALSDLSRAIEINPAYRDAYANRAAAFAVQGDYEKVIEDSRRALALDPRNPENHVLFDLIGVCLQKLNRPREALTEHDEAIRIVPAGDPRRAGYLLNRSYAWSALGDRDRARADAVDAAGLGAVVNPAYLKRLGGGD